MNWPLLAFIAAIFLAMAGVFAYLIVTATEEE